MTVAMVFGREDRTGLLITDGGVEMFATPDEHADRISATATALSRVAEANTILGTHKFPGLSETVSELAGTLHSDMRTLAPSIDENAVFVYVDREAAVLATPDRTADYLPIRAAADTATALATIARARSPTAG